MRLISGMSQAELAVTAGLNEFEVSKIENGRALLEGDALLLAAKALRCSPDHLTRSDELVIVTTVGIKFL